MSLHHYASDPADISFAQAYEGWAMVACAVMLLVALWGFRALVTRMR
jgi:hypothetical protein